MMVLIFSTSNLACLFPAKPGPFRSHYTPKTRALEISYLLFSFMGDILVPGDKDGDSGVVMVAVEQTVIVLEDVTK